VFDQHGVSFGSRCATSAVKDLLIGVFGRREPIIRAVFCFCQFWPRQGAHATFAALPTPPGPHPRWLSWVAIHVE